MTPPPASLSERLLKIADRVKEWREVASPICLSLDDERTLREAAEACAPAPAALSIGGEHHLLKICERVVEAMEAIVNHQPFADVGSFAVERIIMGGLREAASLSPVPERTKE